MKSNNFSTSNKPLSGKFKSIDQINRSKEFLDKKDFEENKNETANNSMNKTILNKGKG